MANFVFFSPEDLNIIKNGPGERRRFVDMELCQLSRVYMHNLANYNKIVNQRNKLLKEIGFRPDFMDTLEYMGYADGGIWQKSDRRESCIYQQAQRDHERDPWKAVW